MIGMIISGGGGQLGQAFVHRLPFSEGYSVFAFDHRQLDIADKNAVAAVLKTLPQVRYWINCAAYTKVDEAERHPDLAFRFNDEAAGYLAEACRDAGVHLVHFSSDYVYDNDLRRPLRELDPTTPRGIYAQSKLAGEERIRQIHDSHTILRTSWVYGPGGNNFVLTMLRLAETRDHLRIVGDQIGAPTYTYDIVWAVRALIALRERGRHDEVRGTFNFANAGEVTWADFARMIFRLRGIPCDVETITAKEFGAPAPRPAYSVMDCARITALLPAAIPDWKDALQRFLADIPNA